MSHRRVSGALSPGIALAGILIAVWLDPTFSWTGDALSHLGIRESSAAVFNGALVLAGGLALPYAHLLYREGTTRDRTQHSANEEERNLRGVLGHPRRAVAVLFAIAGAGLAGVGLFPIGHPLHFPSAVAFYLLVTVVFVIDGLARRDQHAGGATLRLAVVHVAVWVTWAAGLWPGGGLALPELAGALLVATWVWWFAPVPALRHGR